MSSGEDDIFFLASGIAFNILLAAVPFVLLVISGFTYAFGQSPDASFAEVRNLIDRLLPPHAETADSPIHKLLDDIVGARGVLGFYGALTFVWFSTRLFGTLRVVLADIFDIESNRGIVAGKWFDVKITVFSTVLLVAYLILNAYLTLATTRGAGFLTELGLREDVMGGLEYVIGRLVGFVFIVAIFFALYKYLPNRRIRWQSAVIAAMFAGAGLELAKAAFSYYIQSFNPGSLYTGTLAASVIIVFWVYYAALIFILGGEVGQVYELRRTRRLQRAVLED